MIGFRKQIEVDVHDVDFNGVAKTSSILRYLQSAAEGQLTANDIHPCIGALRRQSAHNQEPPWIVTVFKRRHIFTDFVYAAQWDDPQFGCVCHWNLLSKYHKKA